MCCQPKLCAPSLVPFVAFHFIYLELYLSSVYIELFSAVTRVTFLSHTSHNVFFYLFQNAKPHEKRSFAHFVAQLSLDNSQKICSEKFNSSSDILRLATSGTCLVNVRVTRVTQENHEKLYDKMGIFKPANGNA